MTDGSIPVGGTTTNLDTVILTQDGGEQVHRGVDIPEEDDRILMKVITQFLEGQP